MKKVIDIAIFIWIVFWLIVTIPVFWVSAITYRLAGYGAYLKGKDRWQFDEWQKKIIRWLDKLTVDDTSDVFK